ncbi:cytochrome c [Methylophaga sp.]|uniref:cytochrome c n=1 Tax=Methylophaga sp. TaxID=2024840 RepID=UPI00271FE6F3|nr:cytochrome c [Methylophaga sp.]MDO8827264.1 cytochrome c [Methylophaga sp.]
MNKTRYRQALVSVLVLLASSSTGWAADISGADLFSNTCAACHGDAGVGIPGLAPPLQNPELWQRLGSKGNEYIAGVMTAGLSGTIIVDGIKYQAMVMPPQSMIASEDLVKIAEYVLTTLNGSEAIPDVALIDKLKATPLSHTELRAIRKQP